MYVSRSPHFCKHGDSNDIDVGDAEPAHILPSTRDATGLGCEPDPPGPPRRFRFAAVHYMSRWPADAVQNCAPMKHDLMD